MPEEILALAIIHTFPGKEEECLLVLREFYAMLRSKQYSRDLLYRDAKDPGRYVNLRYWLSEEARAIAHEDPHVHHYWKRLAEICQIEQVFERLDQLI